MSDLVSVLLGGVLGFVETIIGVGVVLPGEVMITALSTTVATGVRPWLGLAVMTGACTGDQLNYWLGRAAGPRLARSRLVTRLGHGVWARGEHLVRRRGGWAVLGSRMLPVVRTVLPAVAGAARMSPLRFTCASVAGSALWTVLWVGAGATVARLLDRALVPCVCGILLAVLLILGTRHLRGRRCRSERAPANCRASTGKQAWSPVSSTSRTGTPTPSTQRRQSVRGERPDQVESRAPGVETRPKPVLP